MYWPFIKYPPGLDPHHCHLLLSNFGHCCPYLKTRPHGESTFLQWGSFSWADIGTIHEKLCLLATATSTKNDKTCVPITVESAVLFFSRAYEGCLFAKEWGHDKNTEGTSTWILPTDILWGLGATFYLYCSEFLVLCINQGLWRLGGTSTENWSFFKSL